MNLRKYLLNGIYFSILLGFFSIIMGDKTYSFELWEIINYFLATFIKAFSVWITNYYLLFVVRPKVNDTIKFVLIFLLLNVLNTLFAYWLGMFLFPKFGVIASENSIYLILRHIFVIVLTFFLLKYLNYRTINKQLQNKYNKLLNQFLDATVQDSNQTLETENAQKYTHNFLVSFRNRVIPISWEKISFFHLEHGNLFLFTIDEEKFLFHKTLNKLEKELNPANFFRINRQTIISKKSVVDMIKLNDRRLKVNVKSTDIELIVSRSNVSNFVKWYKTP